MNAQEAFTALQTIAIEELEKVKREGAAYFASDETVKAREALDQVEKIKDLEKAIKVLEEQWKLVISENKSSSAHKAKEKLDQRTSRGRKTHKDLYRIPILQVLDKMGGRGHSAKVIDLVGELMASTLNDYDCQELKSGADIRWRKTAAWVRFDLVQDGYVKANSPRGIWEISEEGRNYLKSQMTNSSKVPIS